MIRPQDSAQAADRWLFPGVLLVLFWLPLPWGSHVPWAPWVTGLASSLLLALWLLLGALGKVGLERGARVLLWPMLLWLLWIGWVTFQVYPVSPDWLQRHAPAAFAAHDAVTWDEPFNSISIAPSLTVDALILTLSYFVLYWLVVLHAFRRPERMRLVMATLVAAGVLQALYGSVMVLSGLEYGVFEEKRFFRGDATGTFVNRNHFANYLALCSAAGVGLILADLERAKGKRDLRQRFSDFLNLLLSNKIRVRLGLVIMVIGLVMSESRMGNTAYFASLCVCGFLFVLIRERHLAMKAAILFLSVILIDVMIVSRWFGLERVVQRLEQTELSEEGRTQLLEELPPTVSTYALTGSGLGTFALAHAPFRGAEMLYYWDHAHNDYAEFLVEVGLPGVTLLLLLTGAHLVHALRVVLVRRRRLPAAVCCAAIMGLVASAIHATAEFNLQIPANASTLVVLLALAACCSSASKRATLSRAVAPGEQPSRESS